MVVVVVVVVVVLWKIWDAFRRYFVVSMTNWLERRYTRLETTQVKFESTTKDFGQWNTLALVVVGFDRVVVAIEA